MKIMAATLCSVLFTLAAATASAANTIAVVGNGRLDVMPDKVTVDMAVVTKSTVAKDAQASNATISRKLGDTLTAAFKLQPKDIKTTSYSVGADYRDNPNGTREFIGYSVRHAIAVTITDVDRAGELADLAVTSGANEVNGIQFGLQDQKKYELQALQLAMADAQSKAQAIAAATGFALGRVIGVSEGRFQISAQREEASRDAEASPTKIYPEAVVIVGELTVTYAF